MASDRDKPYQNDNSPSAKNYVPAPMLLYAFSGARRVRGKTPRPGGGVRQRWKSQSGLIYEWDYLHGRVEVYDRRGRHLGEFDPETGERTKRANPDYQVEP
jgi:hypothetical protein